MVEGTTVDRRSIRAKIQREKRQLEIVKAAQIVIGKQGFHGTSISHVLTEAGISRGTFYLYFDGREALFNHLLEQFSGQLRACIKPIALEERDPVGQLYSNLVKLMKLLMNHQNLTMILLQEALGFSHNKGIRQQLQQLNSFLHRMVTGALVNGAALGLIRKVDEQVIASAVIGSVKEVIHHRLASHVTSTKSPEDLARELLEFGLKGLRP